MNAVLCPPDKGGGAKRRGVLFFAKPNPPLAKGRTSGSLPPYQGVTKGNA
jgi:hypothetical protein